MFDELREWAVQPIRLWRWECMCVWGVGVFVGALLTMVLLNIL